MRAPAMCGALTVSHVRFPGGRKPGPLVAGPLRGQNCMHTILDVAAGRSTLDDVAEAAGVSRMTVSNVYGRPAIVADKTRRKVLAAAAEMGYGGPSPVGRTLRRGTTEVLGMIFNVGIPYVFSDPGAAEFMRGVAQGTDECDLGLLLIHAAGPAAEERVRNAAVDAYIAWSLGPSDAAFGAAVNRRIPIVAFGGRPAIGDIPTVSADNVGGARASARHLVDTGCRRFAVVGCRFDWQQFGERIDGWRDALGGAGIEWDAVVQIDREGNSRADGQGAAQQFLRHYDEGDRWGILALTDVLALGVLHALQAAGIDVPEQVAVAGFDDIEESASSSPGLTTVHQDIFAMGRECALRAAGQVTEESRPFPTSLVVRGSTVSNSDVTVNGGSR
jgi:DNA-binding LacI/PurR family transcriptional regulator